MLDFYLIVSDYRAAYGKQLAGGGQPADPAQCLLFREGRARRQICRAERGGFSPAQRSRDEQRVGMGAVRTAVAIGVDGGRSRAEPRDRRGEPRCTDAACGCGPTPKGEAAGAVAPRVRSHLFRRASRRAQEAGRSRSSTWTRTRYHRFTAPALAAAQSMRTSGTWAWRRIEGKALSVLRLAKASSPSPGARITSRGRSTATQAPTSR